MLPRLKVVLVLMPVALAVLAGVYIYSLWTAERDRAADVPVEASGMMMRDLLAYHKKRGSFPGDLKDLEGVVWEKNRTRAFSIENRGFTHRNYFYLYTRLASHRFTLWALPIGGIRDDAVTMFVAGSPGVHRSWKGAALSPDFVSGIKANPSEIELSTLGLVEQSKVATKKN
ncbi:MAG: hypothetical protein ACRD6X_18165 [Pyrinomonadaceae bacterium]